MLARTTLFLFALAAAGCNEGNGTTPAPVPKWEDRPITMQEVRFPAIDQAMKELKGKVVVVDFWALWCQPCVEKFPRLAKLQKKYGDRGLVCVSISQQGRGEPEYAKKREKALADVKAFLEKNDARFPNFVLADFEADDAQLQRRFKLGNDIPFLVVLDREGVPVWNSEENVKDEKTEEQELEAFLEKVLEVK